ncbi:beta-ribofuranosylaminobenzene 5'-phosphate synthase family protein [Haloplanus aerogenes]|uniref:Beta-ribofuranosylaminobenzene 5'-phosphate synthase n=1 Tax=Haloplanus aerogenes TaxID=660522 RepID=A0A3M0CYM0_9EURY|nr:beta-ribofuranosylaminobenzene 5'-phosphate synthase family protein [Haloplanus aerogenes]AZH26796.1 GHMP kinase [Haloplanus aerogenes]RMB09113.1 beta-ribofuranosylaminobenzene 5'-phosphate synthase [Haloplanus aerogenes]
MPRVSVTAYARLHFGFCNLSLERERLYGSLGVGLDRPHVRVTATPHDGVRCDHPAVREYAERVVALLDVPGADLSVEGEFPRHVGLGSGTQFALATLVAVARATDADVDVRDLAPDLGRGGRSGVGVATFEDGGFVLDAGHPTARFTTSRPEIGQWSVPPVAARHPIPGDWRFLLVVPDAPAGPSGDAEDRSMRSVVESAPPSPSDRLAGVIARRVLPAITEASVERFGAAVAEIGRLNGTWYADEQGGVYRPPAGELVAALDDTPAVYGAGQSSWGPAVYGVTDADRAAAAREAGRGALDAAGVDGRVLVAEGRNRGACAERRNE